MADEHRRVEPRQIAGSGMATDPERIQKIADEAERHARSWRAPSEVGFGDVLGRAPARGELADVAPPPPPAEPAGPAPADAATAAPPAPRPLRATPRAPDPRQRALLQRLERALPPTAPRPDRDRGNDG